MRNRFLLGWATVLILGFCLPPAFGAGGLGEELMTKVMYNEPGEVAALLEKAADVNAAAADGSTALAAAKKRNAQDIVEYLQQHGAR